METNSKWTEEEREAAMQKLYRTCDGCHIAVNLQCEVTTLREALKRCIPLVQGEVPMYVIKAMEKCK